MVFQEDIIAEKIRRNVRRIQMIDVAAAYNLERALRKVAATTSAPGSDGVTSRQLRQDAVYHILSIQRLLLLRLYRPGPLRKVRLQKPSGGYRTIQIPRMMDRLVGRAILNLVAPKFQPYFPDANFAFQRGRGVLEAVYEATTATKGFKGWIVKTDISSFFDRLQHRLLLQKLEALPIDDDLLHLVALFFSNNRRGKSTAGIGVPQGSVLSPFLANLYLADFDRSIGELRIRMIRYADDIFCLSHSKRAATSVLENLKRTLKPVRLVLSENKTKIVSAKTGLEFLGFWISSQGCSISDSVIVEYKEQVTRSLNRLANARAKQEELTDYAIGWLSFYSKGVTDESVMQVAEWTAQRCGGQLGSDMIAKIIQSGTGWSREDSD